MIARSCGPSERKRVCFSVRGVVCDGQENVSSQSACAKRLCPRTNYISSNTLFHTEEENGFAVFFFVRRLK
jgi:hypothetical protein